MTAAELELLSKPELIAIILRLERRLHELEAEVAALRKRNAELEAEVARLRKNSSNSSRPPSSDIVKPPKPPPARGRRRRRIGGQPGHPRHERPAFSADQIDAVRRYALKRCPDCGGRLRPTADRPRILQQVELVARPVRVTEHRSGRYRCTGCGRMHDAPIPASVRRAGLFGPTLTALVVYLKAAAHASYSTICHFLRDVVGIRVSRGYLVKLIRRMTTALNGPYRDLLGRLPDQERLNVDETGHKENGKGLWTWCFRAERFTLFRIAPSRGSDVLRSVLGRAFDGVLGCDYFSAYRKYMKDGGIAVQFCLAHLIREVKYLISLPDAVTRNFGRRLLGALRRLFGVIHRRDRMRPVQFQRALERARRQVLKIGRRAPSRPEAQNLAERFRNHGAAYFRFITTPGVEPTNNLAEQAIRFVVIDRHVTQGTRGLAGRQWNERIWTARATLAQQGRSVFDYLRQALDAALHNHPVPPLLPSGP